MRLVSSIVVMKHITQESLVIDSVLLVKHPEGVDPTQLINVVLDETGANQKGQSDPGGDFLGKMAMNLTDIDWSIQQMYIQEAPSWFVLDTYKCLDAD